MLIGTDRVKKGTPDMFSRLSTGKFLFAEYSLQQADLFGKITGDLQKCFDESKTKINIGEIQEIIYCYGSILQPGEELKLQELCADKGIVLSLFSIGTIAFDIYYRYPRLAKDYLGIEIDSGQIASIEEFVHTYGANKFSVPLDTTFHFREEELTQLVTSLETSNLVIVTGQAGVGKSRLVLEGCRNFAENHTDYKVFSIINRTQDLFADLRDYFSEPGNYLIFTDDANRVKNFAYFIDLLQRQRQGQSIKVVATVRNYAAEKIRELSKEYGAFVEIAVDKFSDEQIKKLVGDEFGILNNAYLERIADIAKGNARIAVMAAKIATEANHLESISDVSNLYDEYFSTIRKDIDSLINADILKVAGILSFYGAVDRLNEEQMSAIRSMFGINPDRLWNAVRQLHEMEIVDIYENEVAKMSDQVLSTYLFYLTFFKNKVLDFSLILQNFFPNLRSRIVDSLNPVVSAFNRNVIEEIIKPKVEQRWLQLVSNHEQEDLFIFSQTFWPLLQTQVLEFIRSEIQLLEIAPQNLTDIKFKPESNIPDYSPLQILRGYSETSLGYVRMALQLILDYVERRPEETPFVLNILIEDYGYTRHTYYRGVDVQQMVVDLLWERAQQGKSGLFAGIFIVLSEKYLYTYITSSKSKHSGSMTFYNFQIPARADIFDLRHNIWNKLLSLYKLPEKSNKVLLTLNNYATAYHYVSEKEIIAKDSPYLLDFISSDLEPKKYQHDVLVQNYLDFLENHGISFDETLRSLFMGDTYSVHEVVFDDWLERRNYGYQEYQKVKKERQAAYFSHYSLEEFKNFVNNCVIIGENLPPGKSSIDLANSVLNALLTLADVNSVLFPDAIGYYLRVGDPLSLYPILLVDRLLRICGRQRTYEMLKGHSYQSQRRWVFGYYQALPADQTTSDDLSELLILYQEVDPAELPYDLDYLLKYHPFNKEVIAQVTSIILHKGDDVYCPSILALLTNPHTEINKNLLDLFTSDIALLKRAYFFILERGEDHDYDSSTLLTFVDVDPDFMGEYIDHMYSPKDTRSMWNYRDPDFSLLWLRGDYESIFNKVVESIFSREKHYFYTGLSKFFAPSRETSRNLTVLDRQDKYLD
jgi:hypothetical protein